MSIALNDTRTPSRPMRASYRRAAVAPSSARKADLRRQTLKKALDDEVVMVARYAMTLALLCITPLTIFLLLYYFNTSLLTLLGGAGACS